MQCMCGRLRDDRDALPAQAEALPAAMAAASEGHNPETTRTFRRQVLIPLFYGCLEEKMVRSEETAPLLQSAEPL